VLEPEQARQRIEGTTDAALKFGDALPPEISAFPAASRK
jgi:hypothetical protein